MQALAIVVTFHPNEVVFGNVMALVVQGLKVVVVDNGSKENISSVMVLQALKIKEFDMRTKTNSRWFLHSIKIAKLRSILSRPC
jgi:hypothetical protein